MNLKQITLVFETCESVDIPKEMINYMMLSGVTTSQIYRGDGDMETHMECSDFVLHIDKEAGHIPMMWSKSQDDEPMSLFERLVHRDIAGLVLDYGDHEDSYTIPWDLNDMHINSKMEVADEGDEIRIEIG